MTTLCDGNCSNCEKCKSFNLEDFKLSFDNININHKYGYCPMCYADKKREWIGLDKECKVKTKGQTHYPFSNKNNSIEALSLRYSR